MRGKFLFILAAAIAVCQSCTDRITMSEDVLRDKIKGAWVGKLAGCTYGLPVEFRFCGKRVPDDYVIPWDENRYPTDLRNGGNDDIYMNLTFIDVFDRLGLDAPVDSFAVAFATAPYNLWHANLEGRYNILRGLMPPQSGHWKNNPHADDIDFQIEADYAGIMSPGMPLAAARFSDGIGHIMNYGDGWYGGLYVATMYSLAFVSDNIHDVAVKSLAAIPAESRYHRCMSDIIAQYNDNPDDWKAAWDMCQQKYAFGFGCPGTLSRGYDIDAVINSAYVLIGLLYGKGDFDSTMEIATRCGQDADCNPATAGGILGAMIGFSSIPEKWKMGLAETEDADYAGTGRSLNDIYELSFKQACEVIKAYGGRCRGGKVAILPQTPEPVRYECSFEGVRNSGAVYPPEPFEIGREGVTIEFDGCGIVCYGGVETRPESEYEALIAVRADGETLPVRPLPACERLRTDEVFFTFDLPEGHHKLEFSCLNPNPEFPVKLWNYYLFSSENAETQK